VKRILAVGTAVVLVLALAGPGRADLITGLAAYYPFDGTAADLSGNGRHLGLFGGAGYGTGLIGQSLSLPGNSASFAQRLTDDPSLNFNTTNFSIRIWFNFDTATREQTLIEKFSGGGGPAWSLTTFPNALRFGFDGFAGGILNAAVSIPTGTWHHVVVRRDGSAFDLFYDGALVASGSTASPIGSTTLPLLIGMRNALDGRDFSVDGRIDEVALWTRALTNAEVAALYNNGRGTPLAVVPEPASWLLAGMSGLVVLAVRRGRRPAGTSAGP